MAEKKPSAEFTKFHEAMGKILSIPKEELDRRAKLAKKDPKTGRYVEPKKG